MLRVYFAWERTRPRLPRGYPPLTPAEVVGILSALGFHLHRQGRGDHEIGMRRAEGRAYMVTVDKGERQFDDYIIRSMITQAGVTRETFYGATPTTARKIGR